MFDNHDIVDDYCLPNRMTAMYIDAVKAWREYAGRGNLDPMMEDGSYYTFWTAGAGGFLLDTRSYQCSLDVCGEEGCTRLLLGVEQTEALHSFFLSCARDPMFRFVVSPQFSPDPLATGRTE